MPEDIVLLLLLDPVPELPGLPVFADHFQALTATRRSWPKVAPGGWCHLGLVPGLIPYLMDRLPASFLARDCCYLFEDFTGRKVIGYLVRGHFPGVAPAGAPTKADEPEGHKP